jgi:hypothetical protein
VTGGDDLSVAARDGAAGTSAGSADVERAVERIAGPGARTLATLWATVDIERTLAEREIVESTPAAGDALLGARVVIVRAAMPQPPVAIVEPLTEGRLAATLARHGEGPAGRYIAVADGLEPARARAAASGIDVSRVEPGPFGRSMLVLLGPATGPHLILCDPAVPSTP